MNIEEFFVWCTVMLPLVFTPGPANIAIASVSSSRGLRQAFVFACGITFINIIVISLMGFGFGLIYLKYRSLFYILEKLGACYVIYLGYKIFQSVPYESVKSKETKEFGFKNGVILQLLNAKLYPSLAMMYSLFLDGDRSTGFEVLELGVLLLIFAFFSYMLWALMGLTFNKIKNPVAIWIQSCGFGLLLMGVGVWLLFLG